MTNAKSFNWQRHPEAEAIILKQLKLAEQNPFLAEFKAAVTKRCSTGLMEWVDHIGMPYSEERKKELEKVGYEGERFFHHPGAQLPNIVLEKDYIVALAVDCIADFLLVRGMKATIEGSPFSGYRRADVSKDAHCTVLVVERRGVQTLSPIIEPPEQLKNYFLAKEHWMARERSSESETKECVKKIVSILGQDQAAVLILSCEREYWQARNTAAQIQKNRQDRLGLGWANHDHHTFRSSRKNFPMLIQLFESLGFHCRERFYAGAEAGWGAQVMENPRARLVLFLDVDLLPGEIEIDFAHQALKETSHLGTVGLWCALHGDSILTAGMHHLEAQFNFDALGESLAGLGVGMMEPFSNFPYLKQAFTKGEMWPVDPARIHDLLEKKLITKEQAEKFTTQGAIGSHMENLQRKEGYKGFNQKNVSVIIEQTDPRR